MGTPPPTCAGLDAGLSKSVPAAGAGVCGAFFATDAASGDIAEVPSLPLPEQPITVARDITKNAALTTGAPSSGSAEVVCWNECGGIEHTTKEGALEDEKAILAKFPFTEEELQKALEIMKKKAADDQTKCAKKT